MGGDNLKPNLILINVSIVRKLRRESMCHYKWAGIVYSGIPKCPGTKFDGIKVQRNKKMNANVVRGISFSKLQTWRLTRRQNPQRNSACLIRLIYTYATTMCIQYRDYISKQKKSFLLPFFYKHNEVYLCLSVYISTILPSILAVIYLGLLLSKCCHLVFINA